MKALRVVLAFALLMAPTFAAERSSLAIAVATGGHGADLAWAASPDSAANPALTYNVYRIAGACPATVTLSQWTKLTGGIATVTFSDTGMSPGQYCYAITAFLNGVESVPTTPAAAVIPLSPPSGLVISNSH
jgi:hypothetical protein